MKYIVTHALWVALAVSTQQPAAAATELPPINSPLGVVTTAVGVGFSVEKACTQDKQTSCSDEVKKAGQNLLDYTRGKKNGWRSLEKKTKKLRSIFKF
jgi:hypothetical protein